MVSSTAAIAALLSTGLISLAPNLILFLFPGYASGEGRAGHNAFLSLGQAIAAGGLLGDVFLHTLPHAYASSSHEEAGVYVLLGFTLFFTADLIIRCLEQKHIHEGINSNGNNNKKQSHGDAADHRSSMILLNMAGDALHNFTDGLAIGASYAVQKHVDLSMASLLTSRGGLASISILLHEVPHELGDFCTLIRAGFSKSQAILAQFLTAIAAFMGTAFALYVSEGWNGHLLLFVTAGGFVYLAATTILPEVLDESSSPSLRLAQLSCFCLGIGFLYIVSLMEEHEHEHHVGYSAATHHHHHHHTHEHDHHHGEL